MADKSPRQHMSKKAGKSLKERRAEKQAKATAKNKIEIVPPAKKLRLGPQNCPGPLKRPKSTASCSRPDRIGTLLIPHDVSEKAALMTSRSPTT